MEIIIALVVIVVLGYWAFTASKKKETSVEAPAPYKVETPPVAEPAPVAEAITPEVKKEEAPAKKPRKPRAPKAEKAVKEKAPAKTKARAKSKKA